MNDVFARAEWFGGIVYQRKYRSAVPLAGELWEALSGDDPGRKKAFADDPAVVKLLSDGVLDERLNFRCPVLPPASVMAERTLTGPLTAYLHITESCNLACSHCMFKDLKTRRGEMAPGRMERLLDILEENNVPELRVTGGEATVYPHIVQLLTSAKRRGMYVMLNTNCAGDFDSLYKTLADLGVDELITSLDGDAEYHDAHRDNSFTAAAATLEAIKRYKDERGLKLPVITVNFCFGKENVELYDFVLGFCVRHGFNLNLMPVRDTDFCADNLGKKLTTGQFMEFSKKIEASRHLPEVRASGIKLIHKNFDLYNTGFADRSGLPFPFDGSACGAANFGIAIASNGDCYPCGFEIDDKTGTNNIFEKSLGDIWNSAEFNAFRHIPGHEECASCEFLHKSCQGPCKVMVKHSLDGRDGGCYRDLMGCGGGDEWPVTSGQWSVTGD